MAEKTKNYGLTKPLVSEFYDVNVQNENMDIIDEAMGNIAKADGHTITFTQSTTLTNIISGETLSTIMGKVMRAIADLITHLSNKTPNPHNVTKSDIGLDKVPNVATNDQTPTYTAATTLATLTSGEKLSVSMGKIMKAITDFISHLANKENPHGVTAAQAGAVPTTRKVNGKALSADISLTAEDIGADASGAANTALGGAKTYTDDQISNHTHNYAGSASAGGAADAAVKLETARTFRTKLNSTSTASFDGTADVTPGVTGTLPIKNGGTGATTAAAALTKLGITAGTTDLTAGTSELTTGAIYLVYE